MTVRVQIELSDEEDKIVEVYRIEHNKKTNEDAIRDIIKEYKTLKEFKEKKSPEFPAISSVMAMALKPFNWAILAFSLTSFNSFVANPLKRFGLFFKLSMASRNP